MMANEPGSRESHTQAVGIIALVALVTVSLIATGFITGAFRPFGDIPLGWPDLVIGPTPSDPLRIAPPSVAAGEKTRMSIGFYNTEQADVAEEVLPEMSCTGISGIEVVAEGQAVPMGAIAEYRARVSVPQEVYEGYYPCLITISRTQKAFFLKVD